MCRIHNILIVLNLIRTHLDASVLDVAEMTYNIILSLMSLTLLSVYSLFYYVFWFDFIPLHFIFVY